MSRAEETSSGPEGVQLGNYLAESRRLGLSIVAILPLVLLYQLGIVQGGSRVRILAEIWMMRPFSLLGWQAATVVNAVLFLGLLWGLWEVQRGGSLSLGFLTLMLLEGALYALLLYSGAYLAADYVERVLEEILAIRGVPSRDLLLALGAGVYEELLFRLLLLAGGIALLRKFFLWNYAWSAVLMLVVSSLLFSAVHHLAPYGEPFSSYVFTLRALCGAFLGGVFLARGLGVAVWTHAIYNVFVLVLQQ